MAITIPYKFEPRSYQLPALRRLDEGCKRLIAVWHRRAGKEKTFLNWTAKAAFQRVGTYYYIFPTYSQARKVLWDGRDKAGFAFMDHFPAEVVDKRNESELRIELVNSSAVQLIGSDNVDNIMGTNPVGCVFSEYALQDPRSNQRYRRSGVGARRHFAGQGTQRTPHFGQQLSAAGQLQPIDRCRVARLGF